MLTLVIYDISDDKLRTKLADHLRSYGLRRVQYSGFIGNLNPNDRLILSKEVRKFLTSEQIGERKDSIYIIPICERCTRLCRIISEKEISLTDDGNVVIIK